MLYDDVLLHIFHLVWVSYNDIPQSYYRRNLSWRWDRLVHVCQRWRSVVFASPNFLDLKLVFCPTTPVERAGIWPPLPIIVRNVHVLRKPEDYDVDAAIVHHNRVCEINLRLTDLQLQRLASAMQKPFPALIHLRLDCYSSYTYPSTPPVIPDGFLGGFAPFLQSLKLHYITFPALPKLILSATHLVRLSFENIPGFTSPEAIVTVLAGLAKLKYLYIYMKDLPISVPEWESRRPPPPTRAVLPALSSFVFLGGSEYLEDFVARIDAPLLEHVYIRFYQPIFDIVQLAQFMRRATGFQAVNEAHVSFYRSSIQVESNPPRYVFDEQSGFKISCGDVDWDFSYLEQIFTSFSPLIHMMKYLFIYRSRNLLSQAQEGIESTQWLEILHPFTAVKNLYIIKEFAECIAPALQDFVGEGPGVADVLPALESLFLDELQPSGPIQEGIRKFVASRQLSGRPVTVSLWEIGYEQSVLSV